jgi:Skp family chaperone for outer membrane proteins
LVNSSFMMFFCALRVVCVRHREMMGYWKEARNLEVELSQRNTEIHGMKSELAALRMELSMERQARQQAEAHVMVSELQEGLMGGAQHDSSSVRCLAR